MSVDA